MSDLDRYLTVEAVEKAARALWDEPGWEQATHEQRQHHREAAERALSAVAPLIAAQALSLVRADIRVEALIRDAEGKGWTGTDVFKLAGQYTPEWLAGVLAERREAGR